MVVAVLLSLLVPPSVYWLLGVVVKHYGGDAVKYRRWLFAGLALYLVSWWLPSPLIDGQDTSFTTHFVGGGLFTGFVWCYLKKSQGWKAHWLVEAFSLFALVSALGVMNELLEIVLYEVGYMKTIADTSWDLLANTLGALTFYVAFLYGAFRDRRDR